MGWRHSMSLSRWLGLGSRRRRDRLRLIRWSPSARLVAPWRLPADGTMVRPELQIILQRIPFGAEQFQSLADLFKGGVRDQRRPVALESVGIIHREIRAGVRGIGGLPPSIRASGPVHRGRFASRAEHPMSLVIRANQRGRNGLVCPGSHLHRHMCHGFFGLDLFIGVRTLHQPRGKWWRRWFPRRFHVHGSTAHLKRVVHPGELIGEEREIFLDGAQMGFQFQFGLTQRGGTEERPRRRLEMPGTARLECAVSGDHVDRRVLGP